MPLLGLINEDTFFKYALPTACVIIGLLIVSIIIKLIFMSLIITHRYNKASRKRQRYIMLTNYVVFMLFMSFTSRQTPKKLYQSTRP